jgi:hypothetical protein
MKRGDEMMMRKTLFVVVAATALVLAACGGPGSGETAPGGTGSTGYSTKFPLPASVSNFTDTGNESINFQTKTSLGDTITFYREAFAQAGLTERTINTAITDATFSLVFDGDPSGKAIVVQGVDLGNGTTNVNIRFEDV